MIAKQSWRAFSKCSLHDVFGLALVLALFAPSRSVFAQGKCHSPTLCGSNVPRNANTDPGPADCGGMTDGLRAKYAALMQEYAKLEHDSATAATQSERDAIVDKMQDVRDEIHTLRQQWEQLKGTCGDQGDLAGPSAPNGGSSSGGSSGGGGTASGGGGSGSGGGANGGNAGGGGNGSGGGGRSRPSTQLWYMWAIGQRKTKPQLIRDITDAIASRQRTAQRLDSAWQQVNQAHPASDYFQVPWPGRAIEVAIPDSSPPFVKSGLAATNVREREVADLLAFAAAFSRYLGAQGAHDSSAMRNQADAMVPLIDSAAAAAYGASQLDASADDSLVRAFPREHPSARESRELRMVRARVAIDSAVSATLAAASPPRPWPDPQDIEALNAARRQAYAIRTSLPAPSAPPAPVQSASKPQGSSWPHPKAWWAIPVVAILALGWYAWSAARHAKPLRNSDS